MGPALSMARSVLPHGRLTAIDQRLALAAAKPVIVPGTIVIDHGKVFVSQTFLSACRTLGISVQPARPYTPTDKPRVAYCTSSGRSVRSCGSGWSGVLGAAADLRPAGRNRHTRKAPGDTRARRRLLTTPTLRGLYGGHPAIPWATYRCRADARTRSAIS
jgi:hypothetical protein